MDEYEKLERELAEEYEVYVTRFRNLHYLENQLDEYNRVRVADISLCLRVRLRVRLRACCEFACLGHAFPPWGRCSVWKPMRAPCDCACTCPRLVADPWCTSCESCPRFALGACPLQREAAKAEAANRALRKLQKKLRDEEFKTLRGDEVRTARRLLRGSFS
jgi:hypothetical protein